MAEILRGDIVRANLDPTMGHEQSGQRPVLIISNDIFNARSGTVIAVALTTQPQKVGFPLCLELKSIKKNSSVKISQIRVLSNLRLGKKIGKVSPEEMDQIIEGLNEIIS